MNLAKSQSVNVIGAGIGGIATAALVYRFAWRNELSVDEGKSWRLREDHVMTRRA